MSREIQYVVLPRPSPSLLGQALKLALTVAVLGAMVLSGLMAWRWVERNFLHWGIEDGKTTLVNEAELLQRIQAFEIVSVKHHYTAKAEIDVDKVFGAGPARVGLPGWVAGQNMKATGEVLIAAGVDLSALTEEDIQVVREGGQVRVVVSVPEPIVLSREVVRDTMDIDTSQGLLTRVKTRIGLSENDLRDQANDRLTLAAEKAAVESGILQDAATETKARLETFLNSLAAAAGQQGVTYVVEVVSYGAF